MSRAVSVASVVLDLFLVLGSAGCADRTQSSTDRGASAAQPDSGGVARAAVIEARAEGDVASLVRETLASPEVRGRKLVVYVGAKWCKPCQRFHEALSSGRLDGVFPDVAFLLFDFDRDSERLAPDGYGTQSLPLLAVPAPDGAASGKRIEGGIKGEGTVDYIGSRLRSMLDQP